MRWTVAQLARHKASRTAAVSADALPKGRRKVACVAAPIASEDTVQFAVVEHLRWLARPGVAWWHHPAGGWRAPTTGARLKALGARAGLPDILVLIEGRLYGLELKRERGGRLSPVQIAMHVELRAAGAVVETAAGVDQALAVLAAWGALNSGNTRDAA